MKKLISANSDNSLEDMKSILGQAANLAKSNSESTAVMLAELTNQRKIIGGMSTEIIKIGDTLTNIGDRINNLEQSEEITTNQNENITTAVKRRLFEILGGDEYDVHKYYRIFAQRLYSNARKNAGLGSKVARTRKRDYQRVLDYVEAWEPQYGCAALRAEADLKAALRKKAKQEGYDC